MFERWNNDLYRELPPAMRDEYVARQVTHSVYKANAFLSLQKMKFASNKKPPSRGTGRNASNKGV